MAKQLNIDLRFNADTSQALKTLQELRQNLNSIASIDISTQNLSKELKTAASSAQALQTHLNNAFNVKTGNLDLSRLNSSLKQSGASLSTLSNNLLGAGISGERAFLQFQSSIASANTQLVKSNGLISNFMTTLKNTARWQISSSVLHGFMGAMQSAYGYAQDLNESLTNIRIVTGANADEMARFASEANKSAKALSTTTTDYTNASLIYFQQGLNEKQVKERTDITIKMANATGQSVGIVSDQLTAVWNNFDDGSKSLEYYADVMTALGAATASSTDEIAGGLEKFAAVAETIGLSYEYAASALATITSNTRQSEEVVGTALKTIFARIQGLNLGETLDDGTTLNKYSEALQKVGISIFDSAGQLKNMDNILDEMAAKWGTLAKDQQVALAQTVAGVRQYNQLVSLMDNWNAGDSDSMVANLETAYGSTGALQQQADIYEESWEAASDRVRASLEAIYKELVPDDTFIGLLNGLEKVLAMVEALVKAFGGLEGILLLVSSIALNKFSANIGEGIQAGIDKVKTLSTALKGIGSYLKTTFKAAGLGIAGATQATFQSKSKNEDGTFAKTDGFVKMAEAAKMAQTSMRSATSEIEKQQALSLQQASATERTTDAFKIQTQTLQQTTALTKTVKDNAKLFTEETSQQLLNEIESVRVLGEKRALLKEQEEVLREQNRNLIEDAAEELHADAPDASGYSLQGDSAQGQVSQILKDNIKSLAQISGLSKGLVVGVNKATGEMKLFNTETKQANDDFSNLESLVTTSVSQITQVSSVTAQLKDINLDDTFASAADKAAAMQQVLNKTTGISDSLRQKLQSAIDALKSGNAKQFNTILSRTGVEAKNIAKALGVSEEVIKKATQAGQKQAANIKQQAAAQNEYNNALNTASQNIQNALANASKLGPTIAQGLSQFSSLAMSISSVSNAVDTLSDSSASWTQKLTASAMALTMGFRGFMIVIQGINTVLTAMNSTQAISNALASAQVVLTGQMTAAKAKETVGTIAQLAVEQKLNAAQVAAMLTEELGLGSKQANALARLLVAGAASTEAGAITSATAAEAADIAAKKAGTAANIAYAASQWLAYWPMLLIVAALAAIVAIIVAVNKAEQARIENNKKMAERSKETADALQEEVNANEELMKTYQEALSTYEETGNNKDALREAALKLASAYGIEGAAVDALAGDYDSLTKKIQRARVEELKQLKEAKDNAMQDAGTVFGDVTSGVITGDTYRQGFGVGWSKDDETAALNTFNQDYQYLKLNESGRVDAMADMSDPKQMYAYFQELENWIKAQEEYARENDLNLSASELYTSAVAEMEAGKEYYNQLKEYMSEASEIQAEISAYDTLITTNGKTKGINDIDNLNDYLEFEKEFTKNYATSMGFAPDTEQWAEAEKYAKNYLTVFEDLNKFQLEARGFEGLIDNKDYDLIKQYYDTLSESEKEVFWTAGIDENSSMAEITSFMDNAQSYLNANSLYATIALKDEAVSAFDQGDYKTLKTIFENEDSPYNMEWMDFLSMSFAEQEDYIKNAYVDYNEILAANSKALKDNAENVKVAEQAYNDATSKVEKASVAWQNAASDVVDHDKVISDAKTQFGYGSTLDGEYYHHIINSGKYTGLDMSNYREENGRIVFDVGGFNAYKMFSDINLSDYLAENNPFAQQWQTYMDYVNQYQTALDNHDDSTANQTYQDFYSWMESSGFYKDMAAMAYGTGNYDGQYSQAQLEGFLLTGLSNVFSSGDTTNPMTVDQQKDAAQYFLDALMFQMDQEHKGLQGVEGEKKDAYDDTVTVQGEKKTAWDTAAITNQESLLVDKSLTEAARQQEFEKNNEKYGLNTEEVSEYADHLRNLSEAGELTNTVLSDQPFIADRVAQGIMRMNKGVEDLTGGFKDWTKVLKSTDKSTAKYGTALKSLRKATENILDIEADQLTDSFFESAEAMELLGRVAEGDLEAIDELRVLAAKDIILGAEYDLDGISETEQAILDSIAGLESENLEIGATLNESQFGQSLLNAAIAAEGTVADIQGMFETLGWEPDITTTKIPISQAIQQMSGSGFVDVVDPLTGDVTRVTTQEQMNGMSSDGMVEVFSINGDASVYRGGGGSTATPPKGGGGGGGGSKPKKAEPTKKSDVVKRYKEIEDQLDDIRDEADRVKNSFDKLYGKEQEAAIQRLLELEQQEISLMKQKAEEAKKFMQEDLDELMKVSAEVDVEFKVDEKGNLVNYTEEMTELYEELTKLETEAGDEWDKKEQEEIAALKEKITKLEEAIEAYEETRELLEDINAELEEMAGTPPLPLIKSELLDVYYEVEDQLDDIEEQIKDLEREAEGLTGEARLEVLQKIHELELERVRTLEKQAEIARQDMEDKKAAMEEIAERNDLLFEYDENGNITNYISQLDKLYEAYEELYDLVTEDGLVSEEETAALDAMREDMEQMEEYAQGYRQAMETVEDVLNEIEDIGSGKASDEFVRSDYIDIYKETNDQLDDIDEKINDLERQADKLTGEERIAKLKEIQKLEKERLKILAQQKEIAKQDIEDRKAALEELATLNGLLFDFDSNGNITNFDEQMSKLLDEYEAEYTKFLEDGVITETEQAILDAIDQDIQELNDAIDAYSDAVEQMEDIQNEMEEITESGYVDMDQLDDIGDKLHDINNTLDDIEDAINDASKAADRLYGEARIRQMNKTAQLIEKEIDALEKKKALQQEIIAEEKAELDEFSKGQVKYDSNGNISNYHEIIDSRKDAIRAEKDRRTDDEDGFTETDAEIVQEMIDELERMEEEIDEYEQALEDQEDIENAIDDAFYEWQDLNAEKLSYKLELTLDVNDRELARIERQISRLEGNFYSRAEALALMVGGGMGGSSKLGELNSQLGDLKAHYAEVKRAYEAGEISHAAYVEQTQQLQAEIENTAAEMEALQEQMDSYYKDTLAAARQELNFHISQIEHLTGVLGHYKNILTALGKSQDYEIMGTVLEGQVEALENEVQVAKRAMGMWQQEADEAYAKYQQALASGNRENADMYYQAYQEAINAANEAENKYYSKAQQWAQALKALMENTLAELAQDLENALTGGTSFETINAQLKRASSLQEEYLTTTNKIYETTKMMRTAQNEIDKTTNSVAKKKLANFITETKQMQNQNKLSKYELSIQQAKYDLLLAEIALEEARFAKSTVRLRRDSEGNFGYVYTADAEAVANAEQKFEDAQNKLYNIGLDGANKYTEKYQQTLSEMYNTLTQLQTKYLQGGFESEAEYNAAVSEAKAYYYEKLGQYSDLYSVALTTDSRVVADAWSTDFADMTQQTETWMNAVTNYLSQVRAAFAEWEQESDRIASQTVGTNLETVKQKVAGIVSESDAMVVSINNSVIPAIQSEINEVQRLTDQYMAMNGQMTQAINNAYALSDALQSDIDASVEKEMANMEVAEQEEIQTQLDILTQQYNETLKAALEDNDISDEEQAQLDAIEREITALQNADSLIAEFEEAYKAAIADEVISDEEQEALNAITQKLIDLKDEMAALEITNETLDALIAKIAEVESMESFIEKYRTAYKAALEDDNIISPAEQEGLDAIKEEIAQLRGFDEVATQETNETLSMIADQLATAQVEENAHAKIVKDILDLISVNVGDLILKVSDIYNGIMSASGMTVDTTDPASYDTGGYTGQWGPSGKWAMLHEKELILNKGDTANFLASLDLLDSILSTIDLHAMNSQFNSMINSPYIQGLNTKEALEQMVTIEANFPNATDKSEIEEAFKGLVNLASQYANRK